MVHLQGILGVLALPAIAWLLSEHRTAIRPGGVAVALALQFALAFLLLRFESFVGLFAVLNAFVLELQRATEAGTTFVFGFLGGGALPYDETQPGASYVLAFRALPLVVVLSALASLLFHWRVLEVLVRAFAVLLRRTLGLSGAVGLGAAANVFVGMIETPVLIRPYLGTMTRSELFAVMTCGMATIAGTVMVLYAAILGPVVPDALGHILTASIISAPAALLFAHVLLPETEQPVASDQRFPSGAESSMDAVVQGTVNGLQLLASIIGFLIVFVAFVELLNGALALLPEVAGTPLTLQRLLGWLLAPVAWLMGIPWREAITAGSLLGTKIVLNELLAYVALAEASDGLEPRSRLILVYALCGFANFGSLGIMLGGLNAMVPERRTELVQLAPRTLLSGVLATCLTGTVVGLLS
jgi:CNT family concentrative nucleoside transporter